MHAIDGIPKNCQILHVEQEVVGDDTSALQCVLNSDVERTQLLDEEARLLKLQVELSFISLKRYCVIFCIYLPNVCLNDIYMHAFHCLILAGYTVILSREKWRLKLL